MYFVWYQKRGLNYPFRGRGVPQEPKTRHVRRIFQTRGPYLKLKGIGREKEDQSGAKAAKAIKHYFHQNVSTVSLLQSLLLLASKVRFFDLKTYFHHQSLDVRFYLPVFRASVCLFYVQLCFLFFCHRFHIRCLFGVEDGGFDENLAKMEYFELHLRLLAKHSSTSAFYAFWLVAGCNCSYI